MTVVQVFLMGRVPSLYAVNVSEAELTAEVLGAGKLDPHWHVVCDYKMYRHIKGNGWERTDQHVTSILFGGLYTEVPEYTGRTSWETSNKDGER